MVKLTLLLLGTILCVLVVRAQENDTTAKGAIDKSYLQKVEEKAQKISTRLSSKTQQYLDRIKTADLAVLSAGTGAAGPLTEELKSVEASYAKLSAILAQPLDAKTLLKSEQYDKQLDKLRTMMQFLSGDGSSVLASVDGIDDQVKAALGNLSSLREQFIKAELLTSFFKQRQQAIAGLVAKHLPLKQLEKFNKEIFYYNEQINSYKEALKDPELMLAKGFQLAQQIPAFRRFFSKYSDLAQLFPQPTNLGTAAALQGLQTRAQVQQLINNRGGSSSGLSGSQLMQQNMGSAQAMLQQWRSKEFISGDPGKSAEMPGFKPADARPRSFTQNLVFGFNVQNTRARSFFPTMTDFAVQLGYRFAKNGEAGLGASYKMGWGNGLRDIRISSEGIGLRSYMDWKIKGQFYISGGYEQNYLQRFNKIDPLKDLSNWQKSGLIGISKRYNVGKKLTGDIKLLFDFLSYQQIPRTQPILFRFGYQLK